MEDLVYNLITFSLGFTGLCITGGITYGAYKVFKMMKRVHPMDPAPLQSLKTEVVAEKDANAQNLAKIIHASYVMYAIIELDKINVAWNLKKVQEYLKVDTKSNFADGVIQKVLFGLNEIDKARRDAQATRKRQFPNRYREEPWQAPWVSITLQDVYDVVVDKLMVWEIKQILRQIEKEELDIPPFARP